MDDGEVAVIIGAGSGIGRSTATRLASSTGSLVLVGDDEQRLHSLARELDGRCREVLVAVADVTDDDAIRAVAEQVARRWARVNALVHAAGVNGVWAPLGTLTIQEWRRTIDVNLTGTFVVLHHFEELLRAARGSVVVVGSIHGSRVHSVAGASAYASSKSGQLELVRKAALELAPAGVRVNAVCPGSTDTNINNGRTKRDLERIDPGVRYDHGWIPLANGDQADPAQVASVITFLLSPEAEHVSGAVVHVDGAQSLLMG